MAHDVVMPQLGMAQDAGLIMAWHKAPGDAVAADDVLMEVETDKATMEVPAGRDGVLAAIRADAGKEVPVGEVIAVIAADAAEAETVAAKAAEAPAPAAEPAPADAEQGETPAPAAPEPAAATVAPAAGRTAAPAPSARAPGARILATPKARRLAAERGIDLADVLKAGASEPILVADLDLAPAPGAAETETPAGTVARAAASLTASAGRSALDSLLAMADPAPSRAAALAAFAAGAYRRATAADRVTVAARGLEADAARLSDPDRAGLTELADDEAAGAPDLAVVDLSGSRLTGYRPGGGAATLTVTAEGTDGLALTLTFDEAVLPLETAAHILDDFARRIDDPIRHIL